MTETPTTNARGQHRFAPTSKVNDLMANVLVMLVLLAPVPAGSNRPVLWMGWAAVLGLLFAVYFLTMAKTAPRRSFQMMRHKNILALGLCIPLAGGFQILPIAAALPAAMTSLPLPVGLGPETLSLVPSATALGIIRLLSYGAFFVLMLEVSTQSARVNRMGRILFLGISAHALWAMISLTLLGDSFLWGPKTAYLGSATGTFINRNSFAAFMAMGLVLGLSLILQRSNPKQRRHARRHNFVGPENIETAFLWMCLILILSALAASGSRMGLAAGIVGATVVFALMSRQDSHRNKATLARNVILGGIVISVIALTFGRGLIERGIFVVQNSEPRQELYRQTLGMILERPWFGYGLDSFSTAFELFHKPPLHSAFTWQYAHSTYLTYWAELGLIAGSLPILIVFLAGKSLIRALRNRGRNYAQASAAMGALGLGALHSLVDFPLEIEANVFLFLALLAMGIAHQRQSPLQSPPTQDHTVKTWTPE